MKAYEAAALIAASPDAIWTILTDAPSYSAWDSGVDKVDGRIAPGETITVYSHASPGRAFPVKVTDFTPGRDEIGPSGSPSSAWRMIRID